MSDKTLLIIILCFNIIIVLILVFLITKYIIYTSKNKRVKKIKKYTMS